MTPTEGWTFTVTRPATIRALAREDRDRFLSFCLARQMRVMSDALMAMDGRKSVAVALMDGTLQAEHLARLAGVGARLGGCRQ